MRARFEPGTLLGHYRIEALLGAGGMGQVYRARDERLHRDVAIKILPFDDNDRASKRLLREARAAAGLSHPAICTIHEVGESDGCAYISMELVDGRPLSEVIKSDTLSVEQLLRLGRQLVEGLAHAHERGVVHGDLKPANAIVAADGRLKLVDFGLARQVAPDAATMTEASFAKAGIVAGTLAYMAPEQLRGAAADTRSDVWALGAMLSEMTAKRPDLPDALRGVVARCLEQDRDRRYANAGHVLSAFDSATRSGRSWTGNRPRSLRLGLIAVTAVAVAMLLAVTMVERLRQRVTQPAGGSPAVMKLAVLPFENLTGDTTQEYFSDGLTEEMIAQIGKLQPDRLGVIARTSAMQYKKTAKRMDDIGRELGVEYVLEGSARREGNHVRITAQLIRVRDETQLWADSIDRDLAGIMAVQNDVAAAVAHALALTLLPGTQERLKTAPRINPEAYEAYLRGREHMYRLNPADLDEALHFFEAALQKEPSYALAYAGIAEVWGARQQLSFAPPREALPKATAAANRAVSLDDGLAEVHSRLAGINTFSNWDWIAGEREFKRAIDLNPNDADARRTYSHYLYIMKRPDEAILQSTRALELDPLNPLVRSFHGTGLLFQRRPDEAIEQYNIVLRAIPNHALALNGLANALHQKGSFDEALATERIIRRTAGATDLSAALERGFAAGGYRRALREEADAFATRARTTNVAPIGVAGLYLKAGEVDASIEWLKKSFDAHDPNIPYLGVHPNYDLVRRDPRFQDLIRQLKLPN
jgi:eukaryotic-like serine/threonine-protein kinase